MSEEVEHKVAKRRSRHIRPRPRGLALWLVVGFLLLAAVVAAIGALRQDVYSARGLVGAYLNALAAHDTNGALSMPGVAVSSAQLEKIGLPAHPSRALLRGDALGRLSHVAIVSDRELSDGRHRVIAQYQLNTTTQRSAFYVRRTGAIFGLLPTWVFSVSPTAVVRVTVLHGHSFSVGGHQVTEVGGPAQHTSFSTHGDYLVFAPSAYQLGYRSTLLAAERNSALVTAPASIVEATVDVEPTAEFDSRVSSTLHHMLANCTGQHVLEPTGCPFGTTIDDRVQREPAWTMVTYPIVTVRAAEHGWTMPSTQGVVHLKVSVQSLFDGSVATHDADQAFTVSMPQISFTKSGKALLTLGN